MRRLGLFVLPFAIAASAAAQEGGAVGDRELAAQFLELADREAASYTFRPLDGGEPFGRLAEPVLKWSNPVVGSIHGGVYLWTRDGRPEVVASLYKWYSPFTHRSHEFHSLAPEPIVGERDGVPVWTPSGPGVMFRVVPDAPEPAGSAPRRQLQMRAIAEEFSATQTDREGVTRDMRLLSRPVYRYEPTGGDVIDGALFVFVLGTDPEALLLLEARPTGDGPRWHYALAPLNSIAMEVRRDGRVVWEVDELPWAVVRDRTRPYTNFSFGEIAIRRRDVDDGAR